MKQNPYVVGACQNSDKSQCIYRNAGNRLDIQDNFCDKCGAVMSAPSPSWFERNRRNVLIAGALVVLLGWGLKFCKADPPPSVPTPSPILQPTPLKVCEGTTPHGVLAKIRSSGIVRIAVEADSPPMNFEENGKYTGFEHDVAEAIAKKIGVARVEIVPSEDYEGLRCLLKNGNADWFMGGYVKNADFKEVIWTESYLNQNGYCLLVKQGSGITNVSDLKNKKIAIYGEAQAEQWVKDKTINCTAVRYTDSSSTNPRNWMLRALIDDKMDAVVYDYPFAKEELKKCLGKIKMVQFNLNSMPYSIGMPDGNDDMLSEVDKAIKAFILTDEYKKLVLKYLSSTFTLPSLAANVKQHIVKTGESLSMIAKVELNNVSRWTEIWELNKSRVPNENLIHVGDVLQIPEQ